MLSRFVLVGGACALLSNASVIVLVQHGFTGLMASLLAFGPVLLIGYVLHSAFTFATQPSRLTFTRYALATAANFPIWAALLYLLGDVLKAPMAVVAPTATVLVFVWNYGSARWAFIPRRRSLTGTSRAAVARRTPWTE